MFDDLFITIEGTLEEIKKDNNIYQLKDNRNSIIIFI